MNEPIEQRLKQVNVAAPQLDWREIWIEQGRNEALAQTNPKRWWCHPAWTGLSAVSTLASVVFAVLLLQPQLSSTGSRGLQGGTSGAGLAQGDSASTPSPNTPPDINIDQESVTNSVADDSTTDTARKTRLDGSPSWLLASAWLGPWRNLDLTPDVQRRQMIGRGEAGLEVLMTSGPAPSSLPPRDSRDEGTTSWQESLRPDQESPANDSPSYSNPRDWL